MGLRIGFDLDGVLANLSAAVREVEVRLFGADDPSAAPADSPQPGGIRRQAHSLRLPPKQGSSRLDTADDPSGSQESDWHPAPESIDVARASASQSRRRGAIWDCVRSTPNFWMSLEPTDENAVRRIHEQMLRHRWEVVFITQRPATHGETVQRQTQRWLIGLGFDAPSVLVIDGSRGAAARALRLDFHVDDSAQNCLDVLSDSRAQPILVRPADDVIARKARSLGIDVAHSIDECLDVLDEASKAGGATSTRAAARVGWKRIRAAETPQRAAP